MYILFFWSLKYIINNNTRRLLGLNSVVMSLLRRSIYWVPLILPLLLNGFFHLNYSSGAKFLPIFIAIITSILMQIPHFGNWNIYLSYDYIGLQKKNSAVFYGMEIYSAITAAISEELFFRGFAISVLQQQVGFVAVFIAAFLFFLHHYECKWAPDSFQPADYLNQVIFALTIGTVYYLTKNLYACIIAHLVFNSLDILMNIRKYIFFHVKKMDRSVDV